MQHILAGFEGGGASGSEQFACGRMEREELERKQNSGHPLFSGARRQRRKSRHPRQSGGKDFVLPAALAYAFKYWRDLRVEVRAGASSLRAAEWREKSWNANKTADTRCFPGRAAKGANLAIRAKTETGNFTCLRFGFFYALFPFLVPTCGFKFYAFVIS